LHALTFDRPDPERSEMNVTVVEKESEMSTKASETSLVKVEQVDAWWIWIGFDSPMLLYSASGLWRVCVVCVLRSITNCVPL
jgi:hypothetical protein